MRRRFCAYAYGFLTTVTEGVVHGVHKVAIRLSFGVLQRHKVLDVSVNGGCFTVTNVFSTVIRPLLTVKTPCPIRGRLPVV